MVSIRRDPNEPRMYKHMMLNGYNDSLVRNPRGKNKGTTVNIEKIDGIKILLKNAHAFNVSSVSNIIRKEPMNATNLLPPFPVFWIEGAAEPILDENKKVVKPVSILGFGTLVLAAKGVDGVGEGYCFECLSFGYYKKFGVIGPLSVVVFHSDSDGNIERGTINKENDGFVSKGQCYTDTPSSAEDMRCDCVTVVNFLGLLNAKNVSCPQRYFELNNYNKRKIKATKANSRYHVLKIHKPGEKITKDSSTGENEGKMPLHVVRGHLADYTKNGLFGKYFGTYFIPSHVRGSEKNGTVTKDYALV